MGRPSLKGSERIEKQSEVDGLGHRDESLERDQIRPQEGPSGMEVSSEQQEQLPEALAASSFGPQGAEREVDYQAPGPQVLLPVVRKRTLTMFQNELMQKSHMVVRGLHPGVLDVDLSLDARGFAGAAQERGGVLVGSLLPGLVASGHGRPGEPRKLQQAMSPNLC